VYKRQRLYRRRPTRNRDRFAVDREPCWRHTFGMRCAESGMDKFMLARLMGHSSPRVAERYYIHVSEPHVNDRF